MDKKNSAQKAVYFCVILILVLVMLYSGLRILESTVLRDTQVPEGTVASKTITVNGVDYFPRQDITVVMVLGIDEFGPVTPSDLYSNEGLADMVMLLIFDERDETLDVLSLNRDTMLEMPALGIGGKQAGTYFGQLALSHSYGTGMEDSCENVKNTLEMFLDGLTIDYYVSMNMDAIALLNDAVGGVTVTVVDDFSDVDPSITMGEMTLMGDQAIHFVRTRKDVGDQKNLTRMERQKEYVTSFVEVFREKAAEDSELLLSAYEAVSPYVVTDCSVNTLSGMLERYMDYALGETVTPEGENILGDEYYEFYVDEEKLDELILRLFYAPK